MKRRRLLDGIPQSRRRSSALEAAKLAFATGWKIKIDTVFLKQSIMSDVKMAVLGRRYRPDSALRQ
jgi:hypothetical protein